MACVMCTGDVSAGTGKAKRLKLFGDSATNTREMLELYLFQELSLTLDKTTITESSWMCHKCKNEIDRYFQTIKEVNNKRDQLLTKLRRNLVPCSSSYSYHPRKHRNESSSSSGHTGIDTTPLKRPKQVKGSSSIKVLKQSVCHAYLIGIFTHNYKT